MCGIVGVLGRNPVAVDILHALERLEYRGYDSAGIATLEDGVLARRRAEGRLKNLETHLSSQPLSGIIGIGHTRWATHGKPTEANAHPHATDRVAVVHNGIIENSRELREWLTTEGAHFSSETDTEVVAHLVTYYLKREMTPLQAVGNSLPQLRGAFALVFLFEGEVDLLIGARRGSPLAIGYGEGEHYLGSDAIALSSFTGKIAYLEEDDCAVLTRGSVTIYRPNGKTVTRPIVEIPEGSLTVDKGNHRHFMAKEIHEQPEVVGHTLARYLDMEKLATKIPDLPFDWKDVERLSISACGTAYYAGLVGKYWFERYARLLVEIDVASEFRYREIPMQPGNAALFVSQSGETADTLASLRYTKEHGQHVLSVVNVPMSTIARESEMYLQTLAGPEISVASTKAFTCQLAVLATLAIAAGRARGTLSAEDERLLVAQLCEVPRVMSETLRLEPQIEALAKKISSASDVLFLGRGTSFPLALEGALKLKEISYIHAEGYAAGELKHGPIALIDADVPVIVFAPYDKVFEKTLSNIEEVASRGAQVVIITDPEGAKRINLPTLATLVHPQVGSFVTPFVQAIAAQFIAYHCAVELGTDVDKPDNLAKSVTVE